MTSAHRRPLVRKTAWNTAANLCTALGNVFASVIVARTLGPDGAGQTAYALWAATTAALLVSFGLPACMQRFVAELHGRDDDDGALRIARDLIRRILVVALVVAVAGAVTTAVAAGSVALPAAFLALFVTHAAAEAYRSWLLGAQRFHVAARVAAATVAVQLVGVSVGSAMLGVPGAVLGYALGLLVPGLGALRITALPTRVAAPPPELRARARRYSRETYLALVVSLAAWSQLEVVFLRPSWGDHGVAMFTSGLVLARLAAHGPTLLAGGLLPHLTERAAAGDMDAVRRTYASATRILGALALPLCFGAAAVAPLLVPAVYGDEFRDAIPAAIVLCATGAIAATSTAGSALLYAMERSRFVLLSGLCGAILAVTGFWLVIPATGALGAAVTRGLVQLAMVGAGTWYIARRLGMSVPLASLARSAAAACVCAAAAATCVVLIPGKAALAVAIPAGALTYALAARAFGALEADDARALGSAVDLVPGAVRAPFSAVIGFVLGARP